MKVGLVLPGTPTYSETFFCSKIGGLRTTGAEVIVFAGKKDPHFQLAPVLVGPRLHKNILLRIPFILFGVIRLLVTCPKASAQFYSLEKKAGRGFRTIVENLYLNSHILSQKLDWLHFGFATTALRRENVAKAIGARMAVSLRGYDISLYPLKHKGCYELLWQNADKVHVISNDLKIAARKHGMPKEMAVEKVTPAIDVELFAATDHKGSTGHLTVKILTVARLHWKKGLEYTLEALAILKKKGVVFAYTIIGEGSEYERLAFAAYQLGLQECVRFAGSMPHKEVKQQMEQADIYLQYSLQEGFCNSVLEAQAMGLLCIVSDAEGLPENVLHEQTGWVVPKRRPDLLADQIKTVLNLPTDIQKTMRQKAITRVREEFNLGKQLEAFVRFYQ
jgi:colanic acid/amylovoran biosynthesis glycosyltransferase